ncbi:hypothetical protein AVEN_228088-1 [Araneus ventricosus]|uniref:Uncharacterized protein n=1 Tax=Araneus ventricosus TaxID=182803 RepID=A0A4Y2LQU6_ARAVE|nr:hypothetical protein AVEN_228088-1 [Araneus ventricosus]
MKKCNLGGSGQRCSTTYIPAYLDDPYGFACYWHDLRKEPRRKLSSQHGGYLMVWGAICFSGQTSLAILRERQQSENCQETLANHLLPFGEILGGKDWTFRHDKQINITMV